jgi:purine-nucleoside phosphorylase
VRNWSSEDEERAARAAEGLAGKGIKPPEVAVVLGSGLSSFADGLTGAVSVPYAEIPGFPRTAVVGHRGTAVGCVIGERRALVLAGRVHHYEGLTPADVTFGVRLAAAMGARSLIVTNASGGLDPGFNVGDLMLITDQISVVGGPRRLPNPTYRMAGAYTERLCGIARATARESGIMLREGVYMGSLGPTYETPAEIRWARLMGASAVGMSTVSEVQEAHARGMDVLGVALITNTPIPGRFHETTHEEVLEAGRKGAGTLLSLVTGTLERL